MSGKTGGSMGKVVMLLMTKKFDTIEEERAGYSAEIGAFESAGFDVDMYWAAADDEDRLIEQVRGAKVLWCGGNPPITHRVIESCPDLVMIQRQGIGVNSVDADAAADNGVLFCNVVGHCTEELAVNALSMILGCLRNTVLYDRGIRAGRWPKGAGRDPLRLSALTIGIFGFGGSGVQLARIMRGGFGSRVIAFDPYPNMAAAQELGVEIVDFDTFLREADVVSIHAPLTKETYHVFNADAFSKMKKNAIIVNISRGGMIDEDALADALISGEIDSAGLDVYEHEPLEPESRLRGLDNIILNPHSSYQGREANAMLAVRSVRIPIEMIVNKRIYRRFVINKQILPRFTDYEILQDLED